MFLRPSNSNNRAKTRKPCETQCFAGFRHPYWPIVVLLAVYFRPPRPNALSITASIPLGEMSPDQISSAWRSTYSLHHVATFLLNREPHGCGDRSSARPALHADSRAANHFFMRFESTLITDFDNEIVEMGCERPPFGKWKATLGGESSPNLSVTGTSPFRILTNSLPTPVKEQSVLYPTSNPPVAKRIAPVTRIFSSCGQS